MADDRTAAAPAPLPPPLPPTLAELFLRDDDAAAAKLLRMMDPVEVRAELPQALALAAAPACFLRCFQRWAATFGANDDVTGANRLAALRLVETAVLCMRGMPQPLASDADAELAGALLPALHGARPALLAGFAAAYRVPIAMLAGFCESVLRARAADGVQLLEALRMKHLLPVETVLLAALDQNDLHAADVFVRRNREHQHLFVNMLLTLSFPDKLVKKRISAFKLDPNVFPGYVERRRLATLRYLIHSEQFSEAQSFVRGSCELQEYACRMLVQQRGAAHPVTRYFVRTSGLAHMFQEVDTTLSTDFALPQKDEYDELDSCLSLAACIGAENIAFVDTSEALGACLAHLETQAVVGFDCEWKATHTVPSAAAGNQESPCATLQLASAHRAFVVDIIALGDISEALSPLFANDAVLKLGFASQGDLKLLRAILGKPHGGHDVVVSNLLDLQSVARKLYLTGMIGTDGGAKVSGEDQVVAENEGGGADGAADASTEAENSRGAPPEKPKKKARRGGRGSKEKSSGGNEENAVGSLSLTGVSELYLGKPLDKRARLSDWERRPLTRAQLHYAALDAHALVQILAKMRQQHPPELLEPILRRCTQRNLR